jgi:mannose/fructose/N-acetylgalactosamine-specific phosphotransferase system component IIB
MPIVLFRVDERLIHGQVVVGWGGRLHLDRIQVIDDELSQSPWEQELYCLGVPPEIEASFVSVEESRRSLPHWKTDPHRIVVLVRNVETLERVAEGGLLEGDALNLGGIHHAAGRDRALPYLFLSAEDRARLEKIESEGATVYAQDLPSSRRVPLRALLGTE